MTAVQEAIDQHAVSYMRQEGWFNPAEHPDAGVTLVGVGGIGSPLALALAKLGMPNLTLIDPDTVERHNLPNQMFQRASEGQWKVQAVQDMIDLVSHVSTRTAPDCLEDQRRFTGVVASGLDSMKARANLWERLKLKPSVPLYIDGRLAGEHIVIYAVNPCDLDDIAFYEHEGMYTDEGASAVPVCTRQSIIDVGFMVAGLMTRMIRRHFAGEPVEQRVWMNVADLTITKEYSR